jgi:hypothetical protein
MKLARWSGILLAVSLVCCAAVASAEAPSAWLTAPSLATAGQNIEIKGGNLPTDATMSLKVVGPDASVTMVSVATDAVGNLRSGFVPGAAGPYAVELYDGTGAVVASAGFGCVGP